MTLRKAAIAIVLAGLASVFVSAALAALSDARAVAAALMSFPLTSLAAILALSLGCYGVRAWRWGMLLRLAGHPVRLRDALYLHLSGQTMVVSPGRVGEVLKPWLSKRVAGAPMGQGIGLVFAERIADLIAVAVLALGGMSALRTGWWVVPVAVVFLLAGTIVASSEWFHRKALGLLSRSARMSSYGDSLDALSEAVRIALSPRALTASALASVLAWGLEGLGFYLCLKGFGFVSLSALEATSIYSLSTIVGALTFLPGGIGPTEASMAGLLVATGMSASAASGATLLTRVATLWWGVGLGWLVMASRPRIFRELFSQARTD